MSSATIIIYLSEKRSERALRPLSPRRTIRTKAIRGFHRSPTKTYEEIYIDISTLKKQRTIHDTKNNAPKKTEEKFEKETKEAVLEDLGWLVALWLDGALLVLFAHKRPLRLCWMLVGLCM